MGLENCIDQQDLKAFALGHLDDDRSEAIAAHLSACTRCEETMAGFDDTDDSMLGALREAAGEAVALKSATPVGAVLQQIANPWSGVDHAEKPASTGEWIRDYELLEPLGHGGMGTVYKAVHTRLQRPVAIKLLPSRRLRDPDAVARFEREMRAIGRLDHPAIVRATDAGEADGTHFLVMDYVEGIDLSQLMKLTGPIDVASACEVIRQTSTGLQYAHDQGLIHRDVKPSNLMMEVSPKNGQGSSTCEKTATVKLLDLGLALFGAASEAVDELTTVGQLMGTLDYMAPEQADDSHDVDARADVYSLGATMFKLLTGTAPYETSDRRTPFQKMKALATVDVPSVRTRQPGLPAEVASIVDRMLLRDPASRFQTAADVAQAVAPFCGGHRLAELTQQAMEQRSHHAPRDEPLSGPVESRKPARHKTEAAIAVMPEAAAVIKDVPMASRETSAMWPPRRLITRSVMATLGILIVIAAGILIRIKTDNGTLIIECASPDVPVEIRQGTDTVKQLTLLAGENKVTLHSGSYEIVLPAEYDSLTLDAGKFELSRGGEWIARISENAEPSQFTRLIDTFERPITVDDLLPSNSARLTGPSVTPDVAQIIPDPIRQVEFQRLRDRYAELLRKIDALQDSLNVEAVNQGDDHPRVRMFQDSIVVAQNQSASVRDEMQNMLQIEQSNKEKALLAAKRAAESLNPASTDTAQPLYAGKTFDQWLQVIQTERSNEELTQALDAIGVLGRGKHDRQAANAILDLIARYPYANPMRDADDRAKLSVAAIRSMRGLNADETLPVIIDGFKDRQPSVHEFVLVGVLSGVETLGPFGSAHERTNLGMPQPLDSKLRASEPLTLQLIQLWKLNSGKWSAEKYPAFSNYNSSGHDLVFNFVQQHVGVDKPSQEVEAYLRKFVIDPDQLAQDQDHPNVMAAAMLLARHSPEEVHARIFVRAIQDSLRAAEKPMTAPGGGDAAGGFGVGGGFFPNGIRSSSLHEQMNAWNGLAILGKHAQPALPLMFEILQHSSDGKSVYNDHSLIGRSSADEAIELRYEASMRLFAVEAIALIESQDPKALEFLRAELTRLIGQAPADGPFELTPGRQALLLSPNAFAAISQSVPPRETSPIDIELTNACLLAWKALTGSNPRFDTASLGALTTKERGSGVTIANMPKFVSQ